MTEEEFLQRWDLEAPSYKAWGDFVARSICDYLEASGINLSTFLKQSPSPRVKLKSSLIDKAFYRGKNYTDPFQDIEDKVGCRFVVLLIEHIDKIVEVISSFDQWDSTECRHFCQERDKDPLLFTYQSVHYVVRPKRDLSIDGLVVKAGTPCEIQIRTLLQHAYAELTHDAVYKAKALVEPKVHRTVAKSMALIETTDGFFSEVNNSLKFCNYDEQLFYTELEGLYFSHVKRRPMPQEKSSIVIFDAFRELFDENLISLLTKFWQRNADLEAIFDDISNKSPLYSQSIIIFVVWLVKRKKHIVIRDWPISKRALEAIATDIGESLDF